MAVSALFRGLGLVAFLAGPAQAEVNLDNFHQCLEAQIAANAPALACVQAEQSECSNYQAEKAPAAATLCLVKANDIWSEAIRTTLADIRTKVQDTDQAQIADIAEIEVKYDVLSGLLQCDRVQELALLGDTSSERINVQKSTCTATTMGLSYAKLRLQSRGLR